MSDCDGSRPLPPKGVEGIQDLDILCRFASNCTYYMTYVQKAKLYIESGELELARHKCSNAIYYVCSKYYNDTFGRYYTLKQRRTIAEHLLELLIYSHKRAKTNAND